MEVQCLLKYQRTSVKKAVHIAREIQGRYANEALALLSFIPRKTARLYHKALKSAIANAENNHNIPSDRLVVHRALAESGPGLKRFRPAARGSAHPYVRHTVHVRVVLTEVAPAAAEAQS